MPLHSLKKYPTGVKINMKLSKKNVLSIIALTVIAAVLIFYFVQKNGSSEKTGQETFKVKKGSVTHFTEQTGIIKAQVGAIVKVGTRATGTLTHLGYQVGDYVKKGELIARIDDREILANIRNNQAIVEEQKRELESKNAQYAYSKLNYERELRLLEKEFTTRDSVDKAKKELDMALAQVELGKAKVKEASEKLKALEVSHSYTKIHAPISGYVSTVSTQEGETVVSGLSAAILITIIDPGKLEMWIYVDETDIGKIKEGMKVVYTVDTYPKRKFEGKISRIYLEPETKEGIVYYTAVITMTSEDALLLKTDMTTHVRIIREVKENVLSVKNGAVKWDGAESVVYKITGDKKNPAERISVKTGVKDENNTEITEGLSEGDEVALKIILPEKRQGFN